MNESPLNRTFESQKGSGGFSNQLATGKLPHPLPKPLWLNLGCGKDIRDNFINIDLFGDNPNIVHMDIRKLDLPDNSADLILASDILEHFSHREVDDVLKEWARVLKAGGDIIIRCPSLRLQMKAYMNKVWNADLASYMIFGGQTNPGDFHCIGFDPDSIKAHLENAGFEINEITEYDTPQDKGFINLNMVVKARKNFTKHTTVQADLFQELSANQTFEDKKAQAEKIISNILNNNAENKTEPIIQEKAQSEEPLGFLKYGLAPADSPVNIVWEGSQFVYHSLALINREISSKLIETGLVNLTIVPYEEDQFSPEGNEKYLKLAANDIRVKPKAPKEIAQKPYLWIRHQWPPKSDIPQGAKWVIMQPWEFGAHRKDFMPAFEAADEIWTPSNYSRETFLNAGIPFDKVQVIPNGINPELFTPEGKKMHLPTGKKLKLLYVGGTIYRKGIDILLDSYVNTFNAADDVCLIIKDMGGKSFYKNINFKDKIVELSNQADAPEIIYMDDEFTEAQMAQLYRACNVFVTSYRGEGFSLPTLEAMACGLPVIVPKGGSTDDFVDEQVGWIFDAKRVNIGNIIDGAEMTGEAYMLEPDKQSLSDTLKHVYSEPSEIFRSGVLAARKARQEWTWRKSSLMVLSRIDYLYGTDLAKKADKILPVYDDPVIELGKAEQLYYNENYAAAEFVFESLTEKLNNSDKLRNFAYNRLIELSILRGDLQKAAKFISIAESFGEINYEISYLKARFYQLSGKTVEALESVTQFLDIWFKVRFELTLNMTHDELLVFTADLLREDGDLESAHKLYSEALRVNNHSSDACFGAAMCFKEADLLTEAVEMFNWALQLNPYNIAAKEELESIRLN